MEWKFNFHRLIALVYFFCIFLFKKFDVQATANAFMNSLPLKKKTLMLSWAVNLSAWGKAVHLFEWRQLARLSRCLCLEYMLTKQQMKKYLCLGEIYSYISNHHSDSVSFVCGTEVDDTVTVMKMFFFASVQMEHVDVSPIFIPSESGLTHLQWNTNWIYLVVPLCSMTSSTG